MAKELGMSPRSLIKNIPAPSQPWKAPVKEWIRDLHERRFGKRKPPPGHANKTANRDERPQDGRFTVVAPLSEAFPEGLEEIPEDAICDDLDDEWDEENPFDDDSTPDDEDIASQNQYLLKRQKEFRLAAEFVARGLSRVSDVRKVVLFGSVAAPLKKEVPRFRQYRRRGIEVWHECKDVDLAVWASGLDNLKALQKARSQALNDLLRQKNVGVAHHRVEIFLMEPGTDRYLGRLCCFGTCPKDKPECLAPDCGAKRFLKQHEGFTFRGDTLRGASAIALYERPSEKTLRP